MHAMLPMQPIWQIASIVQGDTEAQNAYNAIINDPQFPSSIQPKGTPRGDFSNVQYPAGDPDCWSVTADLFALPGPKRNLWLCVLLCRPG